MNPLLQQTGGELYRETMEREEVIRNKGYSIVSIWECEYDRLMKGDQDLQAADNRYEHRDRIDPRDSLYGGRTNAVRLENHCKGGEKMMYKDVVSEYPFVNKTKR